jgi:AraC-like DNA-binding protein
LKPSSSTISTPLTQLAAVEPLPFEIRPQIDGRRYLQREFDPDLPLMTKMYSFPKYRGMVGENWLHWHDYYELILPVDGSGRFTMGGWEVSFEPGDLLIVDTLRLHGVSALSGPHRSLVVLFPASFIAGSGGLLGDAAFLDPLRSRPPGMAPMLKATHPSAPKVHEALLALHEACNAAGSSRERYPACKLHLLTVLHHLREAFGVQTHDARIAAREEARSVRLKRVFKLLAERFTEPLSVAEAAAAAGMSSTVFRGFFKHTTGLTLVDYVRQMRLAHAAQRLRDSDDSIADIAAATGFCDQSYLHRCFTRQYHCAPLHYRQKSRDDASGRLSKKSVIESKPTRKLI